MMLRSDHTASPSGHRLNLLLSTAPWKRHPPLEQLPDLLAPLGIHSIRVTCGSDAANVIRQISIHIAVVDLTMPLENSAAAARGESSGGGEGGSRILHLLRNLDQPPPTVVVRPRQPVFRDSARGLREALSDGAFAVLDQPVHLESMLEVMRRILHRHYQGQWPV